MDRDAEINEGSVPRESNIPEDQLARFAAEIESDPEVARALEEQRKIDRLRRLRPEIEQGAGEYREFIQRAGQPGTPETFDIRLQLEGEQHYRRTVYPGEPSGYLTAAAGLKTSIDESEKLRREGEQRSIEVLGESSFFAPKHPLDQSKPKKPSENFDELRERVDARVYGFGQAALEDNRPGLALHAFDQSGYLYSGVVVGQVQDFLGRANAVQKAEFASTFRQIQAAKSNPPSSQG